MASVERKISLAEARTLPVGEHPDLAPHEKETIIVFPRMWNRTGFISVDTRQAKYIRWAISRPGFEPEEIVAVGNRVVAARGWLPEGYVSCRLQPRSCRQYLGRDKAYNKKGGEPGHGTRGTSG